MQASQPLPDSLLVADAFSSLQVRATNGAASPDGKKTAIITGTSSGLGLHAAKHLANSGDWHIIMANRDYSKTLVRPHLPFPHQQASTHRQPVSHNTVACLQATLLQF